jgi:glycosyltransferase involved in cell wall biosynthesis
MKIVHLCLSCFFIDDHSYQENELVAAHARDGHEVLVLASTHVHGSDGRYAFATPGEYRTKENVQVIRLPYHPLLPDRLGIRLRIHKGVYSYLEDFAPDVVLFHGISGWELLTVARYCKNYPNVKFYADNHADFLTAGSNFFSRWVLHYVYYRNIVRCALPSIKKILCISPMTLEYARDFYEIPGDKLEFYPLGGWPVKKDEYAKLRLATRRVENISDEEILFVQSGKQYGRKYLLQALREFAKVDDSRFRFLIVGLLMNDIKIEAEALIAKDPRVTFVGWKNTESLRGLLCAADVYLQPGRQSATMQESLCCGCAVILENLSSNTPYVSDNGWVIDKPEELKGIFQKISSGDEDLTKMGKSSLSYARKNLDYHILAERVLK